MEASPPATQAQPRQASVSEKQVLAGPSRVPSSETMLREKPLNPMQGKGQTGGGTLSGKKPLTVYDEAVQKVQEWNEALNGLLCSLTLESTSDVP